MREHLDESGGMEEEPRRERGSRKSSKENQLIRKTQMEIRELMDPLREKRTFGEFCDFIQGTEGRFLDLLSTLEEKALGRDDTEEFQLILKRKKFFNALFEKIGNFYGVKPDPTAELHPDFFALFSNIVSVDTSFEENFGGKSLDDIKQIPVFLSEDVQKAAEEALAALTEITKVEPVVAHEEPPKRKAEKKVEQNLGVNSEIDYSDIFNTIEGFGPAIQMDNGKELLYFSPSEIKTLLKTRTKTFLSNKFKKDNPKQEDRDLIINDFIESFPGEMRGEVAAFLIQAVPKDRGEKKRDANVKRETPIVKKAAPVEAPPSITTNQEIDLKPDNPYSKIIAEFFAVWPIKGYEDTRRSRYVFRDGFIDAISYLESDLFLSQIPTKEERLVIIRKFVNSVPVKKDLVERFLQERGVYDRIETEIGSAPAVATASMSAPAAATEVVPPVETSPAPTPAPKAEVKPRIVRKKKAVSTEPTPPPLPAEYLAKFEGERRTQLKAAHEALIDDAEFRKFLSDHEDSFDVVSNKDNAESQEKLITRLQNFQKMKEVREKIADVAAFMFSGKTGNSAAEFAKNAKTAESLREYVYEVALEGGDMGVLAGELEAFVRLPQTIQAQEAELATLGHKDELQRQLNGKMDDLTLLKNASLGIGAFQWVLWGLEKLSNGFKNSQEIQVESKRDFDAVRERIEREHALLHDAKTRGIQMQIVETRNDPSISDTRRTVAIAGYEDQLDLAVKESEEELKKKLEEARERINNFSDVMTLHETRLDAQREVKERFKVSSGLLFRTGLNQKLAEVTSEVKKLEKNIQRIDEIHATKERLNGVFGDLVARLYENVPVLKTIDADAVKVAKEFVASVDQPNVTPDQLEAVEKYLDDTIDVVVSGNFMGENPLYELDVMGIREKLTSKIQKAIADQLFEIMKKDELMKGKAVKGKHPFVDAVVDLLTKGKRGKIIGSKTGAERMKVVTKVITDVLEATKDRDDWRDKGILLGLALSEIKKKAEAPAVAVPPPLPASKTP